MAGIPAPPKSKRAKVINFRVSDDQLAELDRAVSLYLDLHPEHFAEKDPARQRSLVIRAALEAFLPALEDEKSRRDAAQIREDLERYPGLV